jgi:hypothetical protein
VSKLRELLRQPRGRYLAAFALALLAFLARQAIFAGDTDLWYHLAAGRYIVAQHALPHEAFFSFLDRPWVDYYWLFQPLVYGVHAAFGYGGLVALRAALFLGLAAATTALVAPWRPARPTLRVAVLSGALLVELPRFASLRPHVVSLGLLALALVCLERGGRWLAVLPPLAAVWANVHGVSWPVLALALGAYGVEPLWEVAQSRSLPAAARSRLLALLLAGAGLLATPHGLALLRVPFHAYGFAAGTLDELKPLPGRAYLDLVVEGFVPGRQTLFNLLALLSLLAVVALAARRRLRPAHLLLVVGGAVFLARGSRFVFEVTLLALPLLAAWLDADAEPAGDAPAWPRAWSRPARLLLLGLVGVVPFVTLWSWRWQGGFPFSSEALPQGVCNFLVRAGRGGTVFDSPDVAGYLEWRLYPRYRIFSDLQTPFLFHDLDTFLALGATHDRALLGRVLARHRPDFLAIGAWEADAPAALDPRWGYRPVAFDWTTVLYASSRTQGELVGRYRLAAVDPFAAAAALRPAAGPPLLSGAPLDVGRAELARLAALDPDNGAVRVALGRLELAAERPGAALPHAERAVAVGPLRADTWHLLGDVRLALGQFREAVEGYEKSRARGGDRGRLGRQLWVCWGRLGEPRRAYRELAAVVDPLDRGTTVLDLFALGATAALLGDREAARRDFTFALWKAPDEATRRRAAAALARLDAP